MEYSEELDDNVFSFGNDCDDNDIDDDDGCGNDHWNRDTCLGVVLIVLVGAEVLVEYIGELDDNVFSFGIDCDVNDGNDNGDGDGDVDDNVDDGDNGSGGEDDVDDGGGRGNEIALALELNPS